MNIRTILVIASFAFAATAMAQVDRVTQNVATRALVSPTASEFRTANGIQQQGAILDALRANTGAVNIGGVTLTLPPATLLPVTGDTRGLYLTTEFNAAATVPLLHAKVIDEDWTGDMIKVENEGLTKSFRVNHLGNVYWDGAATGSGAGLTNLNASNISSGALANTRGGVGQYMKFQGATALRTYNMPDMDGTVLLSENALGLPLIFADNAAVNAYFPVTAEYGRLAVNRHSGEGEIGELLRVNSEINGGFDSSWLMRELQIKAGFTIGGSGLTGAFRYYGPAGAAWVDISAERTLEDNRTIILPDADGVMAIGDVVFDGPTAKRTMTLPDADSVIATGNVTFSGPTLLRTITVPNANSVMVSTFDNISALAATTSAQLAGVLSDETGTGLAVFSTSPTLTTPALGVATATSINGLAITATGGSTAAFGAGGTVAYQGGTLAQFASTTSNQLKTLLSDETGTSGGVVFANGATIDTPTFTTGVQMATNVAISYAGTGAATQINNLGGSGGLWTGATGGTGVNNGTKTITLGANLATTGTSNTTLAFPSSGSPTYTFPAASQTMASLAGTETLTNKTLTSPTLTTPRFVNNGAIEDSNGNELIRFKTVTSAANFVEISGAINGAGPIITSEGQTNVNLNILAAGTGNVSIANAATNTASIGSGGSLMKSVISGSASLDYGSIAAGAEETLTVTVTGVSTTNTPSVQLGWSASLGAGLDVSQAWVSGANTVSVRVRNNTGSAIDPAATTCRATVTTF